MAEYIERDQAVRKAIDACIKVVGHGISQVNAVDIADEIDSIPAADVVEVRHGEWLPIVIQESYFDPPYCDTCKCSMCGYEIDVSETVYNYCPNCGAKMRGVEE